MLVQLRAKTNGTITVAMAIRGERGGNNDDSIALRTLQMRRNELRGIVQISNENVIAAYVRIPLGYQPAVLTP